MTVLSIASVVASAILGGMQASSPGQAAVPAVEVPVVAASAQASQASPVTVGDVEVTGRVTLGEYRQQVIEFARKEMAPPRGRILARWREPVCIGTYNFTSRVAQPFIDRMAERIIEAGADVAEPGCTPNVVVVGTTDGATTAQQLVRDKPEVYRPAISGTDRGRRAMRLFQEGNYPVRWWHVNHSFSALTGESAIIDMPTELDMLDVPIVQVSDTGRLISPYVETLERVMIVIDFTKTGQVPLITLADYAAFISLAQVNLDGDVRGYDSILSLFADPATAPSAMTAWDIAFLKGMYDSPLERRNVERQAMDIASQSYEAYQTAKEE